MTKVPNHVTDTKSAGNHKGCGSVSKAGVNNVKDVKKKGGTVVSL